MNRKLFNALFAAASLCVFMLAAAADGVEDSDTNNTTPFQFSRTKLAGQDLSTIPPFPAEAIISGGDPAPKLEVLFRGDIVYGIYESKTVKLKVTAPWAYDEWVLILSGELHLYDDATDKTQIFKEGDHVMVPKGFTGTWENIGDPYREAFIIERKTFEAVWGE